MKQKYLILWLLILSLLFLGSCGNKDEETDANAEDGHGKGSVLEMEENSGESDDGSEGEKDKNTEDGGDDNESNTGDNEGSAADNALTVMTMDESVDYLQTLSPELLGLSGASMDEYEIYSAEQMVPVNGITCAKLSVYSRGVSDTNTFQGVFLLARDGTHLYRLENETQVVEIPLSSNTTGSTAEE